MIYLKECRFGYGGLKVKKVKNEGVWGWFLRFVVIKKRGCTLIEDAKYIICDSGD